jgi:hypothetical protein
VAWVTIPASDFSLLTGKPKSFFSETEAIWSFCDRCGTTLTYENKSRPGEVDLTAGSLDNPEAFPPNKDVCFDEKLSWVPSAEE